LRSRHLQSILPSLPPRRWFRRRRARLLLATAEPWILDLGELGRLRADVTLAAPGAHVALLLHGWEGSADSTYVLSLGAELFAAGFSVVRLNLRDHGQTHTLNRELFHSCRLPEVAEAVRCVARRFAASSVHLAGFSLGGNFLLRVAAAPALPSNVANIVAICPVLHPERALTALETGSALYHAYFVRRWSRSLRLKQRAWPQDFDFDALLNIRRLRPMTAALVRGHTEYAHIDDYLEGYAITGDRLRTLAVPAFMISTDDDPIIPIEDLEQVFRHPLLKICRLPHGGHCGLLENFSGPSFADRFTVSVFTAPDTG
jgi:predicted alpha/beta-fold hydrolase